MQLSLSLILQAFREMYLTEPCLWYSTKPCVTELDYALSFLTFTSLAEQTLYSSPDMHIFQRNAVHTRRTLLERRN